MTLPAKPPVPWDVFQEHLEEAAFLWAQWEAGLDAAAETLVEVAAGPEQRLLAHLDGLVLGGKPVAEKLLLPALGDDPALARPAAWALLAVEETDYLEAVLAALAGAEPPGMEALGRALGLSTHPAITARLGALWVHAEPPLRALILSVLETRDPAWAAAQLPQTLAATEPALLLPSLRLLRRVPQRDPVFNKYLEYALTAPDAAVRVEAMTTAVALGSRTVWDAVRREVALPEAGREVMGLLALSPVAGDQAILHQRVRDPATRRHALWALGFAGDVEAANAAAGLIADEEVGALAGDALSMITGLVVDGSMRAAGETKGPDVEEVGEDDAPPEVRPEDHLAPPNAEAVAAWWRAQQGRFAPGQRYLGGQPRTPEVLREGLVEVPTWRRALLAVELAAATRAPVTVNLRHWAHAQLRELAASAAPQAAVGGRRR